MPVSEKSSRVWATTSSSCSTPTAANSVAPCPVLPAGLALCAMRQIEQEAESVRLAWLWIGSAATVHNIRDRQSQADHFTHNRI